MASNSGTMKSFELYNQRGYCLIKMFLLTFNVFLILSDLNRSVAVVCTLQMTQTQPFFQFQQDGSAPSVYIIAVITRSMVIRVRVSFPQVEPYPLLGFLFPLCTDPRLPPKHYDLYLEIHRFIHPQVNPYCWNTKWQAQYFQWSVVIRFWKLMRLLKE